MKCTICKHGETRSGRTSVVLQRAGATVIIKDVPADICANCGEYYLSDEVAAEVLEFGESAFRAGAELEIRRYAA